MVVAAEHGREAAIRVLLTHGGRDVNAVDRGGRTACHYACFRGRSGVLRLLLEAGADPTARGDSVDGGLPIGLAREWGRQECITILQEWERAYTIARPHHHSPHPACESPSTERGVRMGSRDVT